MARTNTIDEIKQYRKVEITSVICTRCRMVHSTDAEGLCEFCRHRKNEGLGTRGKGLVGRLWRRVRSHHSPLIPKV